MNGLRGLGARVVPYLPDRVDEGHGLNFDAVRSLADQGVTVLVTVDCGADADKEVEAAKSLGVDSIVTDHHTMLDGAPYPAAEALVNPNRTDSRYPFDHLTGVGLAYKLVQAVYDDAGMEPPVALLELVALGTVGDVGPLIGENRYFVSEGLRRMNRTGSPGLRALIEVSGYGGKPLDSMALSFGLIPRLNAPGRLDDAEISLNLLTSTESEKAIAQAALMEQYNRQRQALTRTAVGQADAQVLKRWQGSLPQVIMVGAQGLASRYSGTGGSSDRGETRPAGHSDLGWRTREPGEREKRQVFRHFRYSEPAARAVCEIRRTPEGRRIHDSEPAPQDAGRPHGSTAHPHRRRWDIWNSTGHRPSRWAVARRERVVRVHPEACPVRRSQSQAAVRGERASSRRLPSCRIRPSSEARNRRWSEEMGRYRVQAGASFFPGTARRPRRHRLWYGAEYLAGSDQPSASVG